MTGPVVIGVARSAVHGFSKRPCARLDLVAGLGVTGDAHRGVTVQHLSRVRKDPGQPNLRQVHLIHAELFDELAAHGFAIAPGDLGENVTTRGLALLDLPVDTRLALGTAVIRVTGLRNPCAQIEAFRPGLLAHMIDRLPGGAIRRKCGVMGVVETSGSIAVGDAIAVTRPGGVERRLEPV
jgi:MOSC domain-containing protein YiiM